MRKGTGHAYGNRNISVVICDTYTSNYPVSSLLAATLYQRNPHKNHMLWNIGSTERYILHIIYRGCWNVDTYKWKVQNGKIDIIYLL